MVVLQLLLTSAALALSASLADGAVHTVPLNRLFEVTVKNTA
eukprot:COSAG03_NODE_15892_length_417_cov_0.911950_1_plen_41_part_01